MATNPVTQRAYQRLQFFIGLMALALPPALYILGGLLDHVFGRTSISAYHYSPHLRDYFSGTLFATGVFLGFYSGHSWLDWLASKAGWLSAWGVALIPTAPDCCPTPDQLAWAPVHRDLAAAFFASLIYFCGSFSMPWSSRWAAWLAPRILRVFGNIFGPQNARVLVGHSIVQGMGLWTVSLRPRLGWPRVTRNLFFFVCAVIMLGCCIAIASFQAKHPDQKFFCRTGIQTEFWLESAAIWAFAWAWLVKSLSR